MVDNAVDSRAGAGFTLVEVLVALFILIVGIIAVMQMLPTSILQSRMAAERTIGSQVARDIMGSIRHANAEAITSGALENYDLEFADDPLTPGIYENNTLPLLNLDRTNEIEDLSLTANPVVRSVSPSQLFGYQTTFQPIGDVEATHLYRVTIVFDYADGRTETYTSFVAKQ